MNEKFVLFDFDGVIADSHALSYELSTHFSPELNEEKYRALYDRNIFASLKKLPSWKDSLPDAYQKLYDARMPKEVHIYKGMEDVIATLAEIYQLAIVSSTSKSGIDMFLKRYQLSKYFSDILGREEHHSKVEKMAMLIEKYKTSASRCIYITDTLGDMREAEEHGMSCIAVSWGVHPHATLERGIPFRIVDTPAEIPDAVDDYFSSAV